MPDSSLIDYRPELFFEPTRSASYLTDDLDRDGLARRNAAVMLAQGARQEPDEVAKVLRRDLRSLGLCPHCGRELAPERATCGADPCVRTGKGSALRGKRRPEETRRRIGESNRRSPKRRAQWDAMRGRKLPEWWRERISEGQRRRKERVA